MNDETEDIRRQMVKQINEKPAERADMEARYGQVWTTSEISEEFDVLGFMAPFVVVRRKSDGKKGSLTFQHSPRYYFDWKEDTR